MYLGIDIGTSSVKAVLVDDEQNIVDQSSAALLSLRPKPLWSEQLPSDWWTATCKAVKGLGIVNRSGVKSIGLTGQMHGATCLGENDVVLRPAVLWNDGRSHQQCHEMMSEMPNFGEVTGNLAMPGFTSPKIRWIREREPETFNLIKKVLLPKDYVRLLMSGDYASDMSDSSGTLWMDVAHRNWSDQALALTGLSRAHMPELHEGNQVTGQLSSKVSNDWGVPRVPICAGAGDNAAGAVGSGIVEIGAGFISLGTSGVTFLADNKYRPNPAGAVHTFCHALPELWHQMSVTLSAASAIDFVARITGFAKPLDLYAAAEAKNTPGRGAFFLPYLSGERTPHNDPNAKGALFGLTHDDTATSLAQAALEGVAFALADGVDALRDTGAEISVLSVIGGGSKSQYWGKILSSTFNLPLQYRSGSDVGPAFGAARLARLSVTNEMVADVCQPPSIEYSVSPDKDLHVHYAARRKTFQKLYKNTRGLTA